MKLHLHTEFESLLPLQAEWNALLAEGVHNTPFLRFEYLRAWWELRGGGEWPPEARLQVVTAHEGNTLRGIAPLFRLDNTLYLLGSVEISDFLDVIVRPQDLDAFLEALFDFLGNDWQSLRWDNIVDASPTRPALARIAASRGWQLTDQVLQPAPYIPLPGDFEAYLASINKKQRHEIRRKMRRADSYEQPVHWYIVEDPAELESAIETCCSLMAQDPQKQAFLTQAMRSQLRLLIQAAFEAGWLQLAFLKVGERVAAGYLNFDYANRIWVYNSGAHPDFLHLSPGWVLLGHLLQWANENGRSEFDFMRGGEEYKYRFGAVDRFVHRIVIQKP
jgi:CelD/BcsL family acetyltransferase involved in cellulose biosynthesis